MKVGTICASLAAAVVVAGCISAAAPAGAARDSDNWRSKQDYRRTGSDRDHRDSRSNRDWRSDQGRSNRGRTDNTWNNGRYNKSRDVWDRLLRDKNDKRDDRYDRNDGWDYDRNRDYRDYRSDRDYRDNRSGGWVQDEIERRQDTKNSWRNIAIAAGAIGILGMLQNDKYLTFAGAAGALYSYERYQQDKKSQDRLERARAAYFDREWFERDGRRYDRRTVVKDGHRYYQFCSK